jgi:4-hydroxythreonine-4-phosphate dehydrogenase
MASSAARQGLRGKPPRRAVNTRATDRGSSPTIVLTTGEPAGVGPDVALAAARQYRGARLLLLGDVDMLKARAEQLGLDVRLCSSAADRPDSKEDAAIEVLHVPVAKPVRVGILERANSSYVLALLDQAIAGCTCAEYDAMVTAPVHKGVICDSGVNFSGHTEYLAERTGTAHVVMMLIGGGMRVALASTHLPLRAVADALTQQSLERSLRILRTDLIRRHGIDEPRILVAGLNPHAGESGHLGREEIEVIEPVLQRLRSEGYQLNGPLPADTLFQPKYLRHCDCVLAMYHDQGLAVLKYASFGRGVNVTLGLPIIRTSVDHGTALDIAGSGQADCASMLEAVDLAVALARRRQSSITAAHADSA